MLTRKKFILNWFLVATCALIHDSNCLLKADTSVLLSETQETTPSFQEQIKKYVGINYFTIFNGPGILPDQFDYSPNHLGKASNDGLNFLNQFSIRLKFHSNLALDIQNRFYIILNNSTENEAFRTLRWEAPRVGVSGRLLSGQDWSIKGAINTDFPHFFPAPLSGYQAKSRTVIFNPGLYGAFIYQPKHSRWSVYSVLNPRIFFYKDRFQAEPQFSTSGYSKGNKPEVILSFQPTLNYRIAANTHLSIGTTFDYRKYVNSNWNILNASLLTNGDNTAWRLTAVPILLGATYNITPETMIFPYITAYPIAIQRVNAETGKQASLLESTCVGMWLSGTVF